MKKKLRNILICFGTSLLIIAILTIKSYRESDKKNGFTRVIKPKAVGRTHAYNLTYNSFYIAGATSRYIYLGNYSARSKILILDSDLSVTKSFQLENQTGIKLVWPKTNIIVDSPRIYLMEGITPCILEGSLADRILHPLKVSNTTFSSAVPVTLGSYIIKTFVPSLSQYILAREVKDSVYLPSQPNLERQGEGIFSLDGLLSYDRKSGKVLYTYFYRNQFICLDTNLNMVLKANTIDTVTHERIKVGVLNADHNLSLSSPAFYVNKGSCITPQYIFIHSGLKADNESRQKFIHSSIIDVYRTEDGRYLFSFYLPHQLTSFLVVGHTLITLHGTYITTFRLNF